VEHLAHGFPVRIESVFEWNTCSLSWFKGEESHILLQISLFSLVEETYVSLKRKPSMSEGGESSTLFPFEICVSF
jgi:hypothetical protein